MKMVEQSRSVGSLLCTQGYHMHGCLGSDRHPLHTVYLASVIADDRNPGCVWKAIHEQQV